MNRREFNSLLGGTAVAWPLAAHAQQRPIPVIGFLTASNPDWPSVAAVCRGLKQTGYAEGHNVAITAGRGQHDRLPRWRPIWSRQVAVIIASAAPFRRWRQGRGHDPDRVLMASDPVKLGPPRASTDLASNVTGSAYCQHFDGEGLEL